MHTLCNRYNSARLINTVAMYGSKMTYESRWQISLEDSRGRAYDHYFVAKPTRKQIRKLHKVKQAKGTHVVVKDWVTKAGIRAVILLVNNGSHHCGYVALPGKLSHMNFAGYNGDGPYGDINVHGGVTWQGHLKFMNNQDSIGFDCAHTGDKTSFSNYPGDEWRDEAYCIKQCESMASQLRKLSKGI